jgi:hypothetical protein
MSNTTKEIDKEEFRRCLNIAIRRWIMGDTLKVSQEKKDKKKI